MGQVIPYLGNKRNSW